MVIDDKARSSKYQWMILEIPFEFSPGENILSNSWANDKGLYFDQPSSEAVQDLQEAVIQRLLELCAIHLTPHQWEILKLIRDGNTQVETAKIMDVNQSSIVKCIHGNVDFAKQKRYGGCDKKIPKFCMQDEAFRLLIQELSELDEGSKMVTLVRSWFPTIEAFIEWKNK